MTEYIVTQPEIKPTSDKQKTETILQALKNKYGKYSKSNVIFPELRLGSGYSDIAQRRVDLFMISSDKGNYTTAFEIKVSRGDFLKDIKDEFKQRGARLYASNFFYVAPKGMIAPDEMPMWAGLMEYDFERKQFNTKVVAPLQSRNKPSWGLICSIIRNVNSNLYTDKIDELQNLVNYFSNETKKAREILKSIRLGRYKNHPDELDFRLGLYFQNSYFLDIMLKKQKEA